MINIFDYWSHNHFEISSYKYNLDSRKNKSYMTSGSDNTGKCLYKYNELGFRGDSIDRQGFKIMSVGCSLTEGVGLNNEETWPQQLSNLFHNGINLNFGTGGRSNDFISRCVLSYFDLIKPDIVVILYTYTHRREYYTINGGIEPFSTTSKWGFMGETLEGKSVQQNISEIQNENENNINWFKNHQLIKYFLNSKNCKWVWNGSIANVNYNDENCFYFDYKNLIDFGVDGIHPGPKHNLNYVTKLHSFITEKYPELL